jgi:hypothetical protein
MKTKLFALMLLAGGSAFAESRWSVFFGAAPNYYPAQQDPYYSYQRDGFLHQDLQNDYRDVQHDYEQVKRLRADIARDRFQLQQALQYGDEWRASAIARDLARDQRALAAVMRDIAHDHRDIQRDQQELYRGNRWGSWWR